MGVEEAITEAVRRGQKVTEALREAVAEVEEEEEEPVSGTDTERTGTT